jgi:hypothetical protein
VITSTRVAVRSGDDGTLEHVIELMDGDTVLGFVRSPEELEYALHEDARNEWRKLGVMNRRTRRRFLAMQKRARRAAR